MASLRSEYKAVPCWALQFALTSCLFSHTASAQGVDDYKELTNVYRPVTNFNVETVRGMAWTASGELLVINTHGSRLQVFALSGSEYELAASYPTLNNPIAVGYWWDAASAKSFAAVLGCGTHALVLHDLATGRPQGCVEFPAETGDLVIDEDNHSAFVSCPGNNTVQQVDLETLTITRSFTVLSQRPRFLYLDRGELADPTDNTVFVAPEVSGNNTVSSALPNLAAAMGLSSVSIIPGFVSEEASTTSLLLDVRPLDLYLPFFAALTKGLPDEDLFRIQPAGYVTVEGSIQPVLRRAGTILTAHGRDPWDGHYWMIGTQALNGDLTRMSEPSLKGDFAINQLVIAETIGGNNSIPLAPAALDLDKVAGLYGADWAIASPYALEFAAQKQIAVIAGAASDRVRVLNSDGTRYGDLVLPDGSIPRDFLFNESESSLFVYCWGSNEILCYDVDDLLGGLAQAAQNICDCPKVTLSIGVDPTPNHVQVGRKIFYDATNSANGRTSCNTCHQGGGMDGLAWPIKDFPHDNKDAMVTQSLKGIEDTFPYHWRGERDLAAFNGAFEGLLGGSRLSEEIPNGAPGSQLDDFMAFVFSLQGHANPRQDPRRVLNPALSTALAAYPSNPDEPSPLPLDGIGDPIRGQDVMESPNTLFEAFSCADCHQLTHGSVGDLNFDDVGPIPTNTTMDVAHFRQLFQKTQDLVQIDVNGQAVEVIRGGFGLSHDGDHPSALDFLHRNPFELNAQQELDLAAFVEQADEGISPAVHRAWYLEADTPIAVFQEVVDELLAQTGLTFEPNHWVSIAMIGTHTDAVGATHDLTWYFLPATGLFYASDPQVVFADGGQGVQSLAAMYSEILNGRATLLVLGMPPCNAFRFAVDRDNDFLTDSFELSLGLDPECEDSDGDCDPDGHEYANGLTHLDERFQARDDSLPAISYWRVDHSTASAVKLVMLYTEQARATITAVDLNTGERIVTKRVQASWFDTITAHKLKASIPARTYHDGSPIPAATGAASTYFFEVELEDLAGLKSTWIVAESGVTMKNQLVPNPFLSEVVVGDEAIPPAFLMRILDDLHWDASPMPGKKFFATARTRVRFTAPEVAQAYQDPEFAPNGSQSPNARQVVAAQLLFRTAGGPWKVVQAAGQNLPGEPSLILAGGDLTPIVTELVFRSDPDEGETAEPFAALADLPNGPILLSAESDIDGNAVFAFELTSALPADTHLELSIAGIFERDQRDVEAKGGLTPVGSFPLNEFWLPSSFFYQMPATDPQYRALRYPQTQP